MNYAINLLPPHLRPNTGFDTRHMVTAALIGMILVCGGLFGWQIFRERQITRELSDVTQEIRLLQPLQQKMRENKVVKVQIDGRTAILAQIERERPVKWSDIILQLGEAVPDNLWLTQLSSDASGVINIRGGANDIDTVSKYANNLGQIPNIAQVSFVSLAQANLHEKADNATGKGPERPGLNVIVYDLSIRLKGGTPK